MSTEKHHFRKVYKSDHLGIADLEDLQEQGISKFIFTISHVRQEQNAKVAGKVMQANIAYFKESIKPLVLNATNAKVVKGFVKNSPFVEDWNNILVELYIDETVKMKGEVVGGVRIKPIQPTIQAPAKPIFTEANFEAAKLANATIEQIRSKYTITSEMEQKYNDYGTAK